jgi:hypothetical protein
MEEAITTPPVYIPCEAPAQPATFQEAWTALERALHEAMTTHGIPRLPGASAPIFVKALRRHGKINGHEVALFQDLWAFKTGQAAWTRQISALDATLLLAGHMRAC